MLTAPVPAYVTEPLHDLAFAGTADEIDCEVSADCPVPLEMIQAAAPQLLSRNGEVEPPRLSEQLQEAVLTTKENVEPFIEKHP